MSLILTMTSLTVLAALSLSEVSVVAITEAITNKKKVKHEAGLETVFTDSTLLYNTLQNYDCHIQAVSENEYLVQTQHGKLRYYRENADRPFSLYFDRIDNPDGLMQNICEFERDYGRNVQDYTYHHIKKNLADNMRIYDEHVEDDEIVLTINLE